MKVTSKLAPAHIVKATRRWIGTPYHDQASVRGAGCNCLGLLRGVWRDIVGPEPMPVPPYSRDWGETGPVEVLVEAARGRWPSCPSRKPTLTMSSCSVCARGPLPSIALSSPEENRFIHAYERTGVIEEHLTNAWQRKIAYAFRFPER